MDSEILRIRLMGWANQIATRYGHPVYLVGSAVDDNNPRDIDVVVILPNEEFVARYGVIGKWHLDTWHKWGAERQAWARDVSKISVDASLALHINIDFKVQPEMMAKLENSGKPRLRLDNVECIEEVDYNASRVLSKD